MSTDKDGTQAWYKHGPVYDADANCDVWGIADVPYQRVEEQTMLMWVYSEADADRIIADHRKAAKADALVAALERIATHHLSRLPDGSSNPDWIWDHFMVSEFARAALANYASNPASESAR